MKKLIVLNLKHFFENDFNKPFEILYKLEKEISENNEIQKTILIPYSNYSDCIFDLEEIINKENYSILVYNFSTTIG